MIGAAYTMTTKREAHWSEQTKAQNTEKGMYVGLKQLRGDGERYVTPARAAAKETKFTSDHCCIWENFSGIHLTNFLAFCMLFDLR